MTIEESYKKRKLVVLTGVALILAASLVLLGIMRARALTDRMQAYEDYRKSISEELKDGMTQTISAMFFSSAYNETTQELIDQGYSDYEAGRYRDEINQGHKENYMSGLSTINQTCYTVSHTLENHAVIKNVQKGMMGIGLFLCLIASFIVLFKELERGDGTLEMWTKCLVTFAIGFVVILNFNMLVKGIGGLGEIAAKKVYDASSSTSSQNTLSEWIMGENFEIPRDFNEEEIKESDHIWFTFPGGPFWDSVDITNPVSYYGAKVGQWFENLIVQINVLRNKLLLGIIFIIFEIPIMSGRIVLLTILFEIVIRKAFFPLAVAEVAGQGARSPGVAYMKKFFGLYLRIGMCALIAMMGNIAVGAVTIKEDAGIVDGILPFMFIFVIYSTVAKLYGATSGLTNQIVGA